MVGTSTRAAAWAAALGLVQVGLAQLVGITAFQAGFSGGAERGILSTYANEAWFGAVAVCLGALVAGGSRWIASAAATVGGAVAIPLVWAVASLDHDPYAGIMSPVHIVGAYALGLALGLAVALALAEAPRVVLLGIGGATAACWAVLAGVRLHGHPGDAVPGWFPLHAQPVDAGLLPWALVACLTAALATLVLQRFGRRPALLAGGLLGLALLSWGLVHAAQVAAPPLRRLGPAYQGFGSAGLTYGLMGLGVAWVLRREAARWYWLAIAASGGFVLVAGAVRLALGFGPAVGGDASIGGDLREIAVGLLVAFAAGAALGGLRRPALPAARAQPA